MSKKNNDKEEEQKKNLRQNEEADQSSEEIKQETPIVAVEEKSAEEKLAELNDKYLRLYADFENYRKRMSKERMEMLKYAGEEVFKKIIPVLDDLTNEERVRKLDDFFPRVRLDSKLVLKFIIVNLFSKN